MKFAQVDERADNGNAGAAEKSRRRESCELPAGKQTHEKSFHGVVEVVSVSDFVGAEFVGDTVDSGAAEVGAGKARAFIWAGIDGGGNVDVVKFVRDLEFGAEIFESGGVSGAARVKFF